MTTPKAFPPVEELLLHRDNMLLIGAVTDFSPERVLCRAIADPLAWYGGRGRDVGGEEGAMPAWIGIELMAQAIGTHAALLARQAGKPPRAGALLGSREYRVTRPAFAAGMDLIIEARQAFRNSDGLASYDCRICTTSGEELASAALTVFEPTDFEQFILGTGA